MLYTQSFGKTEGLKTGFPIPGAELPELTLMMAVSATFSSEGRMAESFLYHISPASSLDLFSHGTNDNMGRNVTSSVNNKENENIFYNKESKLNF